MTVDPALLNAVTWKIPNALALVGSRSGDEWNAMTTSWITQVSMEPVLVGVGVDNTAVTHRLISAGGSFTVNLWSAEDTKVFVKFSKPAVLAVDGRGHHPQRASGSSSAVRGARLRRSDRLVRLRGAPRDRVRHSHVLRRRDHCRRSQRRRVQGGGDERHPDEVRRGQAPLTTRGWQLRRRVGGAANLRGARRLWRPPPAAARRVCLAGEAHQRRSAAASISSRWCSLASIPAWWRREMSWM